MRAILILAIVNGFLTGCSHFPSDNPIEELIEEGLNDLTGVDVDLSADDEKL